MKIGQLIGGIICLALAALLTVLIFALPPDKIMFMVGNVNVPFVPVIVLAVVGLLLIIFARTRREA